MTDAPQPVDLTASLVVQLRQGDAHAAATLERLYRRPLTRLALGYLAQSGDAEDAVQEVFAKVLASTTVPDDFRVWIYRIARNHCLNRLRSDGRRRDGDRLATGCDLPAVQTGQLTRLIRSENQEALEDSLQRLSNEQREVLLLRYGEGLGREDIAAILELPVSVVKSRLYEGMKLLREQGVGGSDR